MRLDLWAARRPLTYVVGSTAGRTVWQGNQGYKLDVDLVETVSPQGHAVRVFRARIAASSRMSETKWRRYRVAYHGYGQTPQDAADAWLVALQHNKPTAGWQALVEGAERSARAARR